MVQARQNATAILTAGIHGDKGLAESIVDSLSPADRKLVIGVFAGTIEGLLRGRFQGNIIAATEWIRQHALTAEREGR